MTRYVLQTKLSNLFTLQESGKSEELRDEDLREFAPGKVFHESIFVLLRL